ncbi:DUF6338 family protein [Streptomyces malaysiensis subsp. malaysiensis]|uniref:DUF6338 family protein n=1 Tax=Streptomyces malaysiensis TaxID=92644 RepID=UPI0024C03C5D|nr:DUF6338 family protein [Streptomyces sp. NA07423]WHX18569.1 DUF6338 family protein [Streptomyces sp. NA07423]
MSHAPTTITQVAVVLLLVLPGVTYQFVRERARGLTPGHRDLGERILRAVTAGLALNTIYVLFAGSRLVHLVYDRQRGWLTGAADNPRTAALVAILLLVVLPASAAWLVSRLSSRASRSTYDSTPTAWDNAFRHRSHCLVRARLKGGCWIGGWYGEKSYASSYPEAADLFLQTAWAVSRTGRLERPLEQSGGIYIRMDDVELLDFIEVPLTSGDGDTSSG